MRNGVSGLFLTLDGVVEAPDQWQFDVFDEDMRAALQAHLDAEDTVLPGRRTYEEWAPYWPTSKDEPYAILCIVPAWLNLSATQERYIGCTTFGVPWNTRQEDR